MLMFMVHKKFYILLMFKKKKVKKIAIAESQSLLFSHHRIKIAKAVFWQYKSLFKYAIAFY